MATENFAIRISLKWNKDQMVKRKKKIELFLLSVGIRYSSVPLANFMVHFDRSTKGNITHP